MITKRVRVSTSIMEVLLVIFIIVALVTDVMAQSDCTRQEYDRCVKMADPLLNDPHLIFPDNMNDIDIVCRRWSQFVDCVKRYTDMCFTEARRQEFNKAVESPVNSVHQMCTVSKYQTEYLKHASCIKSTLTRDEYCGRHYKRLVEQVAGEASRVSLCCSHLRFRECVLEETKRKCDSGSGGGSATRFSRQMLDKALSFLRDQCYNYIPTTGECPGLSILSNSYNEQEESGMSSSGTPVSSATDQQHRSSNSQPFAPNPTHRPWEPQGSVRGDRRVTNFPESGAGMPWMPNSGSSETHHITTSQDSWTPGRSNDYTPSYDHISSNKPSWMTSSAGESGTVSHSSFLPQDQNTSPTTATPTMSVRPSSYGRGLPWTPTISPTVPPSSTWRVSSSASQHTTEPWYPAISNYGGNVNNAVDEPNQQGLSNSRDLASPRTAAFALVMLGCAVLALVH